MNTSPPKPLNRLSSYFQGMFPQTSLVVHILLFFQYVLPSVCKLVINKTVLFSLKKLVNTSPPKPLNGLSSYFQGMFPQTLSCSSSHYFSNISVHLSVNQLSISLSYFYLKKLVTTSPKPLTGLSSYF